MSFIIVTVWVAVLLSTISDGASITSLNKEKIKEMAKQLISDCKTKAGASDSDLKALSDREMPTSHEGLCMLECIFDNSNIMENGKFSKDGLITGFKPLIGNDESKAKNLEQLAETCRKEIGDGDKDKCENAKLLVQCFIKNGKSHGFEVPVGIE